MRDEFRHARQEIGVLRHILRAFMRGGLVLPDVASRQRAQRQAAHLGFHLQRHATAGAGIERRVGRGPIRTSPIQLLHGLHHVDGRMRREVGWRWNGEHLSHGYGWVFRIW